MNLKFIYIIKNHIRSSIFLQNRYYSTQFTNKQLELIKHLRKITNEGVASCKQALLEKNWDIKEAASYILGKQETKKILFDENKLNFGKIALSYNLKQDKSVVVDLRTDCDIVSSTQLFESVSRTTVTSVLAYLEQQPQEYFTNKSHIFTLNPSQLDSVPNLESKQDNLKNLLNRTSSQFAKPVVVENIYVCQNKDKDLIGYYSHKIVHSKAKQLLPSTVSSRVGLVSLKYSLSEDLDLRFLKKLADFLALQVVADPNFDSMEDLLSLKILKYEDFNLILEKISEKYKVNWSPINSNSSVRDALESFKSLNVGELFINGVLYVNSGKGSILVNR